RMQGRRCPMHKLFAVIAREYKEIVKKKSFLVGTLLTPLFMIAIIFLPTLFIDRETKDPIEFTLVDLGSGLISEFKEAFGVTLPDGRPMYIVDYIRSSPEQIDELKAELSLQVDEGTLNFYVIIPEDIIETGYAERYAKKRGSFADIKSIENTISGVVVRERLSQFKVPPEEIMAATRDINLEYKQVGPEGEERGGGNFLTQYLSGIAFVMILFTSIMGYGQHLMRAVMEEKNTRIMEVLVSSLTPFQLMMGKILGLGAAGITQMALWAILGSSVFLFAGSSDFVSGMLANAEALSINFFLSFIAFFILGYFLFATLFALLGSIVSSEKEVQQFVAPITMILVIPIILAMYIMQNPDAPWIVAVSYIPFLTPTMMILRASFTFVPPAEIIIGIVVMIISILLLGAVTARIFRVGILMYGKRPTLPELVKWVKYK
ncbi:MAG TPA: ABC transporter permease, partial [candidate division Zixibacteria bacterium]|nr:ABC transporter permease [candidate division Zixibacteria bacterium]